MACNKVRYYLVIKKHVSGEETPLKVCFDFEEARNYMVEQIAQPSYKEEDVQILIKPCSFVEHLPETI